MAAPRSRTIDRRPLYAALQREWYPTRQAAARMGVGERTLRRRLSSPSWREGDHYRWVLRNTRPVLEVNVPRAISLMNQQGWI